MVVVYGQLLACTFYMSSVPRQGELQSDYSDRGVYRREGKRPAQTLLPIIKSSVLRAIRLYGMCKI